MTHDRRDGMPKNPPLDRRLGGFQSIGKDESNTVPHCSMKSKKFAMIASGFGKDGHSRSERYPNHRGGCNVDDSVSKGDCASHIGEKGKLEAYEARSRGRSSPDTLAFSSLRNAQTIEPTTAWTAVLWPTTYYPLSKSNQ